MHFSQEGLSYLEAGRIAHHTINATVRAQGGLPIVNPLLDLAWIISPPTVETTAYLALFDYLALLHRRLMS